jgi:fructose/tagatose bisphosphate aldolase
MKVAFSEMMKDAEQRNYAVGYFESWNLESLLAVCDV